MAIPARSKDDAVANPKLDVENYLWYTEGLPFKEYQQ
jgi:hypothetical protein